MKFANFKMPTFGGKKPPKEQPKGDPIGTAFADALTQQIAAGNFSFSITPPTQPQAQSQDSDVLKLAAVLMAGQQRQVQPQAAQLPPQPEPPALPAEPEARTSIHDRFADKTKARKRKR